MLLNFKIADNAESCVLCLVFTVAGGIWGFRGGQEEPLGAPIEREQCRLNCAVI